MSTGFWQALRGDTPPVASKALRIVARGMCCAVGHSAPVATAAIRARMNHFRDTDFVDESGQPLIGASLFDVKPWGADRYRLMLQAVLNECTARAPLRNQSADTAIVLLCAEASRPGSARQWAQSALSTVVRDGGYHAASQLVPLGKAGVTHALTCARQSLHTERAPRYVILAGVDSYLEAPVIGGLLGHERLLSTANRDGFIPGEAAAAVALTTAPGPEPALWIDGLGEADEEASVTGEQPLRAIGLSAALRAAARDAGCRLDALDFHASGASGEQWYFRETGLALARALEQRVETFTQLIASQFVGEVGAACAPLTLAWLADVMPRADGPGHRALVHFSNDDGRRAALIVNYRT